MLFGWFDTAKTDQFGIELAEYFIDRIPVGSDIKENKFTEKTEKALNSIHLKLRKYKNENRLNFYKKAKLANSFKWKLMDTGYNSIYVDSLTEWLVKQL